MQKLKCKASLTMLLSKSNRKNAKENCKLLIKITQKVFSGIDHIAVKFDD